MLDEIKTLIDDALNNWAHNSLVDADAVRNVLLDIRQVVVNDLDTNEFWDIVAIGEEI